jgi:hypothetical protein
MNCLPYFCGMVAESICCQMLWCHSLASEFEAVRTIKGDAIEVEPVPLWVVSSRISGLKNKQDGRVFKKQVGGPAACPEN